MKVYEAALKRRSIRKFKNKPVPFESLERCVNAARLAPSARNQQVCEYICINDPAILPGIFESLGGLLKLPPDKGGARPEQKPKAYIVILINKKLELDADPRKQAYYDIGLAAENIMLVAVEEGLGTCPVLRYDESILKPILDIPDGYDIGLLIVMGYPDESPVIENETGSIASELDANFVRHVPKRKLADIIHKNKF